MSNPESTNAKTLLGATSAGTVIAYLAALVQTRYGVPIEITSIVLGGAFGLVAKWGSNLPAAPKRNRRAGPRDTIPPRGPG